MAHCVIGKSEGARMNVRWFLICLLSLMLSGIGFGLTSARAGEAKEEAETKLSLKEVPSAVRKTMQREAAGAKIKGVDKERRDGKVVYETDVVIDGDNYEILVDAHGKLISKKLDPEADEDRSEAKSAKSEKGEKAEKAKKSREADEEDDDKPARKSEKAEKKENKSSKVEKEDGGKGKKSAKDEDEDDEKPVKKAQKKSKHEKEELCNFLSVIGGHVHLDAGWVQ